MADIDKALPNVGLNPLVANSVTGPANAAPK